MQMPTARKWKEFGLGMLKQLWDTFLAVLGLVIIVGSTLIVLGFLFSSLANATRASVVEQLIAEQEWVVVYEFLNVDGQWQRVILTDNGKITDRVSCMQYRRFLLNLRFHEIKKANCYIKGEEHDE